MKPHHLTVPESESFNGPIAIFWDIEDCPVPSGVRPDVIADNIVMALNVHPSINGPITQFNAYGDFTACPLSVIEGCHPAGIMFVDVPNNCKKSAAEKSILIDMFLFALSNHSPSSIVLISGDDDFAPALHKLGRRGYTVILVIPLKNRVSSTLCNAGRFVWDWESIAREGYVSSRAYLPREFDLYGHLTSYNFGDCPEALTEDKAIVYNGSNNTSCSFSSNSTEGSEAAQALSECNNNSILGALVPSPRVETQPSGISEYSASKVQQGDIEGVKGQLVRLVEISGGSLPLFRVASEYLRRYGRRLRMMDYGVIKLYDLIEKMGDVFILVGKQPLRHLCIKKSFVDDYRMFGQRVWNMIHDCPSGQRHL